MNIAVTTSRRPTSGDEKRAGRYAQALHSVYIPRRGNSFPDILTLAGEASGQSFGGILVVRWPLLEIWTPIGMLQYHPGMALHRVAGLRRRDPDTMVTAMELQPGDRVLDCTAGLASDAVVASYAVGPQGRVECLESEASIALLLKAGLRNYPGQGLELTNAMRRVHVRLAEYRQALHCYPPASFDVVYFDPMFTAPVQESSSIAPLRPLANYTALSVEAIDQATRVARRYVVVKDRRDGELTQITHWDDIRGGRKSRVQYLIRSVK
jgi:hypothetical protein